MSLPPIIITDLDNTLYNWVDFFAPSFRGMVHALSKEIDFPEEMIQDAMRKVFKFRGSLEYPVRAEDLAFLEGRSKSEIQDLNRLMFGAFRRCRRKNLKLYDGVLQFLEWIQARQITLVAVTNAPLEIAQARLVDLGVSQFYSAIVGPVWSNVTEDNSHSGFQQILFDTPPKKRRTLDQYFKRVYGLTPEQRKPSPVAYQFFLNGSGPERRNAYVIGDSLQNDLAPARLLGAKTVWAKYGTKVEKENLETVLGITPWTPQQIAIVYDNAFAPDFVAGNIFDAAEIIDHELAISRRIRQKKP